jgi:hypothetical protein
MRERIGDEMRNKCKRSHLKRQSGEEEAGRVETR